VMRPVTYVFRSGKMSGPSASLDCGSKPSVAARFHPRPFRLRAGAVPWAPLKDARGLEYRFVFAVATLDAVLVFDTQHAHPLLVGEGLHYASLTDLAWDVRPDGACRLVAGSFDGYVSLFYFAPGELGDLEPSVLLPRVDAVDKASLLSSAAPEHARGLYRARGRARARGARGAPGEQPFAAGVAGHGGRRTRQGADLQKRELAAGHCRARAASPRELDARRPGRAPGDDDAHRRRQGQQGRHQHPQQQSA